MPDQITLGQWNRTLLQRQHLLDRVAEDAIEVLDRIVGVQSQDPKAAFFGLWSRIQDFDTDELDDLMSSREVVRIALMRGTVFLIDAEDARWIRPIVQKVLDSGVDYHAKDLREADAQSVIAAAAELLDGRALLGSALGIQLAEQFSGEAPTTLAALARAGLPLVQIPPRGLWQGSGGPTYQLFDDWVGPGEPAVEGDEAVKDLIRLYLRGFGPSTIQGIQTWAGLTRLRPLVTAMEKDWELVTMTGPDGQELFDLDGLGIADAQTPAPARLLAPYDNVLMVKADRDRIADPAVYRRISTKNAVSPGFVLVDGRLAGRWNRDAQGRVTVEYLTEVDNRDRRDVEVEVERLQEFCAS